MIEKLARAVGYEKRNYTNLMLAAASNAVMEGAPIIGSLEAAAGIIGRALASATITGAGADNFDAETVMSIGRALIVSGEYLGLVTPGNPLTQIFDFEVVPGPMGATGFGNSYKYTAAGGKQVTTAEAVHIRYSVASNGHGAGVLQNARNLYKIAYHLERVIADNMSGINGNVVPLPTIKGDEAEALQTALKNLKGKTLFVETLMQGNMGGVAQPKQDYEQIPLGPKLSPEWLMACDMVDKTVYRAVGIPLTILSENQQPSREALRVFQTMTIEPYAKLIEQAAARNGIVVDLDYGQAARFDLAGRARAWGILVSNGYDDDLASDVTGFPLDGASA